MPQTVQTSSAPSGANGAAAYQDVRDAAQLSDEEILGIEIDGVSFRGLRGVEPEKSQLGDSGGSTGNARATPDAEIPHPANTAGVRNDGGDVNAQAIAEIFPGGVETARAAAQSADQLAKLDAAYFSSDAGKQADLAAYLYSAEPRAFAAMVEHAARVLAERDPAAFAAAARAFGNRSPSFRGPARPEESQPNEFAQPSGSARATLDAEIPRPGQAGTRNDSQNQFTRERADVTRERADIAHAKTEIDRERQQLRVDKFEVFQRGANDAVVAQVRKSLDATLTKTLPENVNGAARERIAQSIFTEVHGALANDRGLAQQVASVIAQERYDDAAREQVAALVLARARAVMPEIARRIVGEWTSGVVASHRQRAEKQDAASRRIELTGAGGAESVPQRVPSPSELRRMSDQEILDY
jgi:hypothetical protein